jgi:hypothetical protein
MQITTARNKGGIVFFMLEHICRERIVCGMKADGHIKKKSFLLSFPSD